MSISRPILAATMGAVLVVPVQAEETDSSKTLRFMQQLAVQYSVMVARTFVDLTYENMTIVPGSNDLIMSGVKLYPELDWDDNADCEIVIDRLASAGANNLEAASALIEISGLTLPRACFDPDLAGAMQGFGYDGLTADTVSIEIAYDLPSAGADVAVQASIVDAGDLTISAVFDYLWLRVDPEGGDDPTPAALLGEAEIAFENNGLWERIEPMAAAQVGDLSAVPQMAQLMLGQMLTDGGQRTPTDQENALVQNVAEELGRFLEEKNRIVISVAPEDGVWLEPDAFDSPYAAIAALDPVVSGTPVAYRALIGPEALSTALSGGGSLSEGDRLSIGRALLTGIGAPRSVADGQALLMPLADDWNGNAAELIAEALEEAGDEKGAYAMALRAMSAGSSAAIGIADTLEPEMSLSDVLAAQQAAADAWPGAGTAQTEGEVLIKEGDVPAMRKLAYAASIGKDRPRDYGAAYFWASLAAAGGDRGAANLRNRLDKRFSDGGSGTWATLASQQASEALRIWTAGGLGATIYQRVR